MSLSCVYVTIRVADSYRVDIVSPHAVLLLTYASYLVT